MLDSLTGYIPPLTPGTLYCLPTHQYIRNDRNMEIKKTGYCLSAMDTAGLPASWPRAMWEVLIDGGVSMLLTSSLPLPPASDRNTNVRSPLVGGREMGQDRDLAFEKDGHLLTWLQLLSQGT